MAMMKAVRLHEFGGPEKLRTEQVERPAPEAGEVLIRILAASVNPVDWKIREGGYPAVKQDDLPITLGRDACGEVVEARDGATKFKAGDVVLVFLGMGRGGYAEYVLAPEGEPALKPNRLSPEEAAAVPLAAMTAWQGLFDHGGLAAGQRVLIHGGAGGVGHLAVQLAKAKGAWVATTVSHDDLDFARGLGADQVVDYKAERFEDVVEPVDVVFDLISGETRQRSFSVLKKGGALISTLGEPDKEQAKAHGVRVAGYTAQPNGDQLGQIAQLIEDGKVEVTVQSVRPLDQAAEAQTALKEEHPRGKIVLKVAD
jgi:NADPH:quinone reductase-like Zn-dependent oxidoreductase